MSSCAGQQPLGCGWVFHVQFILQGTENKVGHQIINLMELGFPLPGNRKEAGRTHVGGRTISKRKVGRWLPGNNCRRRQIWTRAKKSPFRWKFGIAIAVRKKREEFLGAMKCCQQSALSSCLIPCLIQPISKIPVIPLCRQWQSFCVTAVARPRAKWIKPHSGNNSDAGSSKKIGLPICTCKGSGFWVLTWLRKESFLQSPN